MRPFLTTLCLALLLAVIYLRTSQSIPVKRWLLPVTAAALAATLAACFAAFAADGTAVGYAVGPPLGLSAVCLLLYLLEYCRFCGTTPSLRQPLQGLPHHHSGARPCARCREAFRR